MSQQTEQSESQSQDVPDLSSVIEQVEEIVGRDNMLAPRGGNRTFPQLRVQVDGTIAFIQVRDLDDDTIEELEELEFVERTSSRNSLQVRVWYEQVDAQLNGDSEE